MSGYLNWLKHGRLHYYTVLFKHDIIRKPKGIHSKVYFPIYKTVFTVGWRVLDKKRWTQCRWRRPLVYTLPLSHWQILSFPSQYIILPFQLWARKPSMKKAQGRVMALFSFNQPPMQAVGLVSADQWAVSTAWVKCKWKKVLTIPIGNSKNQQIDEDFIHSGRVISNAFTRRV